MKSKTFDLKGTFMAFDTNGNGTVDKGEFIQAMKKLI